MYGLDSSGLDVQRRAAALASQIVGPQAAAVDAGGHFPEESMKGLGREGLFGVTISSSLGGLGKGPREFVAIAEELGQVCPSTAMVWVMHVAAAQAIASSLLLEGRDSILRDIASGKHLTTLAFSEKGSRSQF